MPKSKVRKKSDYAPARSTGPGGMSSVKQTAPSASWYPVVMVGILLVGLIWISVYYIAGERVPVMENLGAWNFAVGFGFMVTGLIMAVRWR